MDAYAAMQHVTSHAQYSQIIQAAESRGYVRSADALSREAEEGTVGQYGLTLDEAVEYLLRYAHP